MLRIETTKNLYGVNIIGDYEDLDKLYDSISRYMAFYYDNMKRFYSYDEYEYMLSLNYDIRHAYQGDREYLTVENNAFALKNNLENYEYSTGEWDIELEKDYLDHKEGNLYFSVMILYPLIFHYLISFENILDDEPINEWLDTEKEFRGKWRDDYTLIDAERDRSVIRNFTTLIWSNIQEIFGAEKAEAIKYYFDNVEFAMTSSVYCEALLHCEMAGFDKLTEDEKKQFLLLTAFETIDSGELREVPGDFNGCAELYTETLAVMKKNQEVAFPEKEDFFDKLDEAYDSDAPMQETEFHKFLTEEYGQVTDYEKPGFEW